jgi:hypothetical protein
LFGDGNRFVANPAIVKAEEYSDWIQQAKSITKQNKDVKVVIFDFWQNVIRSGDYRNWMRIASSEHS